MAQEERSFRVVWEGTHRGAMVTWSPRYMSDDWPWVGDKNQSYVAANGVRFKDSEVITTSEYRKKRADAEQTAAE